MPLPALAGAPHLKVGPLLRPPLVALALRAALFLFLFLFLL